MAQSRSQLLPKDSTPKVTPCSYSQNDLDLLTQYQKISLIMVVDSEEIPSNYHLSPMASQTVPHISNISHSNQAQKINAYHQKGTGNFQV